MVEYWILSLAEIIIVILQTSKVPLESQAQGTNLFTSAETVTVLCLVDAFLFIMLLLLL